MSLQLGNVWEGRFIANSINDATHSALGCDSSWGVIAWCVHRRTRRQERARGISVCFDIFGQPPISTV